MNLGARYIALLREIGILLLLSVFLGLAYNFFSPRGLPLIRTQPEKETVADSVLFGAPHRPDSAAIAASLNDTTHVPKDLRVVAPEHEKALANPESVARIAKQPRKEVFRIVTLKQFKRLLDEHRGILLDARAPDEFHKGHIKGARNIPAMETDLHFPELAQMPRDSLIIIYCNNPECHLGRELAQFMSVLEFKNMVLYDDGWDGWIKAKMPIDSSARVD